VGRVRGFAITLDAVVALTFFMVAMVVISAQTYQPTAPGDVYLKQLTLDTLTVLEKTGLTAQALGGNDSGMQELLEATPKLACMQISMLNSSGGTVARLVKSGCNETAGLDIQAAARPGLYNGTRYVIKSESWFREEQG
jgi:hypothetical protein